MKYLVYFIIVLLSTTCFAQILDINRPAILHGKISSITSTKEDDEELGFSTGTQALIELDHVVLINESRHFTKTKIIQLVDHNNARYNNYFKNKNRPVIIECSEIFRAQSAWHRTEFLCITKSVTYK